MRESPSLASVSALRRQQPAYSIARPCLKKVRLRSEGDREVTEDLKRHLNADLKN